MTNESKKLWDGLHDGDRQERAFAACNRGDLSELAEIFEEAGKNLNELLADLIMTSL